MRKNLNTSSLSQHTLAVASSCDLQYVVDLLRSKGIFENIVYNFERGSSDDASIEIMRDDNCLDGADVIIASLAESTKKLIHPFLARHGRPAGAELQVIFDHITQKLVDLVDYLAGSSAKIAFIFKYPINPYMQPILEQPWQSGEHLSYWVDRLNQLYNDVLREAESNNIYLLDPVECLSGTGLGGIYIREDIVGGHLEESGAKAIMSHFLEVTIAHLDTSDKIKAIALDLDNTLWDGVFLESMATPKVDLNRAAALLRHVDNGIPICVVSKNNTQDTPELKRIISGRFYRLARNVVKYYVGWNPKSESIRNMAKDLSISPRHIAFFDDSHFERGEVMHAHPELRVYDETEVIKSLRYAEFNFPRLSSDAKGRVAKYLDNFKRNEFEKSTTKSTSIDDYLASLNFKIGFSMADDDDLDRADELVQRTNQQNMTLKRTPRQEIRSYISDQRAITIRLSDKFGSYGTIGVVLFRIHEDNVILNELAISCRALGKGVEQCIIAFLGNTFLSFSRVFVSYCKTPRNQAFFDQMVEYGFMDNPVEHTLRLSCDSNCNYPAWFDVEDRTCIKRTRAIYAVS